MNIDFQQIRRWNQEFAGLPAEEILRWAWRVFQPRMAFASSLGLEDQVLTDLIARNVPNLPIFTLDTGRLFPECYDLLQRTEQHYGIKITVFCPEASAVEKMVNQHGVNLFRESVELRRHCCSVRKVDPLQRALSGMDAWICGLRREQSVTRGELQVLEWDDANHLLKLNPLASWSELEVRDYIQFHHVPYNPLHDEGYSSIGCACCTRAIRTGEDLRAGRWWWENPENRECGLHRRSVGLAQK